MDMSFHLWLEYVIRFSHLVAGVAWIGSSFYFIWMDSSFESPETARRNVEGELFMVHGGFYYQVEKRKIFPGELPKVLHWFKWEATLTVFTGFLLLFVLYYLRGASLLIDAQVYPLTQWQAIGYSFGIIVGSWFLYDLMWNAKLVPSKAVSTVLSVFFFTGLIYGLTHLFSGRGAFILAGAVMGTMMVLNVWVRILPGQAKMIREAQAGQVPDYSVSLKSKTRSVHNTYFIFPVLFIMLSNHYPVVYSHPLNWLLLIILGVSGALTRHAMVTKSPVQRWTLLPAAIGLGALVMMTGAEKHSEPAGPKVEFAQLHGIMENRCLACHSSHPTDDVWKTAPNGVVLESEAQVRAKANLIHLHVVIAKSMPLGNKTNMTEEERAVFAKWLKQEALVQPF
ncbi:MAG: urate hydroxylase PuuD [Bacteriovoracia bacterium]